jgi:hypothetical protein
MLCKTCKKPVIEGEKFVSGFTPQPEHEFQIEHASCAGIKEPHRIRLEAKTMTKQRIETLSVYEFLKSDQAPEKRMTHSEVVAHLDKVSAGQASQENTEPSGR